jgi:hypothetical protein
VRRAALLACLLACATLALPLAAPAQQQAQAPAQQPAQGAPAPAGQPAEHDRDTAAIVLLLATGVVLLGALILWGLARWRAWEPPWLLRWRHATAEAGWRAGNVWAEFLDWLRLGR